MNKLKVACLTAAIASSSVSFAGGFLTNTNQNVAFNRMMSREASIGIDGVYYNPAGVVFLGDGHHLSINWQLAYQDRTIKNDYSLFTNNVNNPITPREFKGEAFAPVIPSFQYAYNKGRWSFQGNFALTGGGGKCTFDNGLGSFERIVAETAMAACGLARTVDGALGSVLGREVSMFGSDQAFGAGGKYSYNSYMHGRQYYFGLSLGAAYKVSDNFSVFGGVRGIYATTNYYGYVEDIKVGNMPLYMVLDPTKKDAANIELSCDQNGIGFTPIIGVDFKTGKWNFSAKYEFKTRMRLKNKSVNLVPSIGNLPANLSSQMTQILTAQFTKAGLPAEQAAAKAEAAATAVLANQTVQKTMLGLKNQFDTELDEAIGEYADGKKIAADIPAYLSVGVGYSPIDPLRINVGFHFFDDKNAKAYNNRQEKLDHGTLEYNAGVEYDINKKFTVSAGWQSTNYGLPEEEATTSKDKRFMDDKSFVTSSNSVGLGGVWHFNKKMSFTVAYFHTFYQHKKTTESVELIPGNAINYSADYSRNNNVFAAGIDINF
ncbi:outer membrane protein transport protein [uncultured Prevotella sp.]|uniref:OmpP1/FadL family transporter n=1 Tax=uncultured Prevotella sp. TaxID=159272 RepID=UPI0025CD96EE|nr:outer membrane protein transport protein [uncultured Prevotella sp.]